MYGKTIKEIQRTMHTNQRKTEDIGENQRTHNTFKEHHRNDKESHKIKGHQGNIFKKSRTSKDIQRHDINNDRHLWTSKTTNVHHRTQLNIKGSHRIFMNIFNRKSDNL